MKTQSRHVRQILNLTESIRGLNTIHLDLTGPLEKLLVLNGTFRPIEWLLDYTQLCELIRNLKILSIPSTGLK